MVRLRHLMIANAVLGGVYGIAMLLWPGPMGILYRVPYPAIGGGPEAYAPISMIRLVGLMALAFAVVCWLFRDAAEQNQRAVAGALTSYFAFALLFVWIQQQAIWGTLFGRATVAVFVAEALAFGSFFFLGRRGGAPQQPPRPPNAGDHVNATRF